MTIDWFWYMYSGTFKGIKVKNKKTGTSFQFKNLNLSVVGVKIYLSHTHKWNLTLSQNFLWPQWFMHVDIHFWLPVSCLPSLFCLFKLFILHLFSFQTLYHQFKFFLNMYFLLVASSQFINELRIGYLYTYWGPLVSIPDFFMHTCIKILYFFYNFIKLIWLETSGERLQNLNKTLNVYVHILLSIDYRLLLCLWQCAVRLMTILWGSEGTERSTHSYTENSPRKVTHWKYMLLTLFLFVLCTCMCEFCFFCDQLGCLWRGSLYADADSNSWMVHAHSIDMLHNKVMVISV